MSLWVTVGAVYKECVANTARAKQHVQYSTWTERANSTGSLHASKHVITHPPPHRPPKNIQKIPLLPFPRTSRENQLPLHGQRTLQEKKPRVFHVPVNGYSVSASDVGLNETDQSERRAEGTVCGKMSSSLYNPVGRHNYTILQQTKKCFIFKL